MLHLIDKLAGAWFDWRARRVSGNPELVSLNNVELNEDGLTVTGFSPAIAVLADGAAAMLEHHNAKNFVEFDMYPRLDRGMQPVRVAVAWANGEMPSAKCVRLEKECERLEGEKRQLLYTFWDVLDGILRNGDSDTLWANDGTTAHEALVEVAAQYDPEVANEFQQRMEGVIDEKSEEVESSWNEDGEPVADHRPEYAYFQAFTEMIESVHENKEEPPQTPHAYHVVMAKASPDDIEATRQFLDALETNLIDDGIDAELLGRWIQNAYPEIQSTLERILLGYEVLVNNACDPSLTYLDWKPALKQLLTQAKEQSDGNQKV